MNEEVLVGWKFYSADFSLQASGLDMEGRVTLIRDLAARKRWHELPDDEKNTDGGPALYVHGFGRTIRDAILDANKHAKKEKVV